MYYFKIEPISLKEYVVTVTISADCHSEQVADWETELLELSVFFIIMDTIFLNIKHRFSIESLQIARSADCIAICFNGSLHLIDHY